MNKRIPIRVYYSRAKLFGWLLLLILVLTAGYTLLTFFIGTGASLPR